MSQELLKSTTSVSNERALDGYRIRVIGAGLAGCEVASQLLNMGACVDLIEMKPRRRTAAQVSDHFAELVCSNSFRSNQVANAVGLLKHEMRMCASRIMSAAEEARVPAGDALAVDRERFSKAIESDFHANPKLRVIEECVEELPVDGIPTVLATGPLTTDGLANSLAQKCGDEHLAFYDAIAPIIDAESINWDRAYYASRWGKGEPTDYVNCPMREEEYDRFYEALVESDVYAAKAFENLHYFEGCLPLEEMASRGRDTLRFGPMKPVGLEHPESGERFHAVLQLRKENLEGSAYNIVGGQTRLKQGAQKEVLRMIPGLEKASFLRFGSIHRNTYINAPSVLDKHLRLKNSGETPIFLAGQITGVEGYVESAACGIVCAHNVRAYLCDAKAWIPPAETAMGGLYRHILGLGRADPSTYTPSNINWSMMPKWPEKVRPKSKKRALLAEKAMTSLKNWLAGMS